MIKFKIVRIYITKIVDTYFKRWKLVGQDTNRVVMDILNL